MTWFSEGGDIVMRKTWLVLSLLSGMGCGVPAALGDIAPYPRPRPPRPLPPIVKPVEPEIILLDKDTKIDLERADVQVSLNRAMATVPRLGLPPLVLEQEVVAEVKATFDLKCKSSRISPAYFTMAFPVVPENLKGAPPVQCTRFSATMDDKPASWTRSRKIQLAGSWFESYLWPTSIREGATQKVVVDYRLRLPVTDNSATFTYVLRSGKEWSGLIGRETVRVSSQEELTLKARKGRSFPPAEESGHQVVWNLKEAEPNEDIIVDIKLP
jgi:hypothetical protein